MSRFKKIIFSFFKVFTKKEEKSKPKIVEIDQNTVLTIIEKLSNFEHKKEYLKPVSLHFLAKKLGTNPTYLSKIINTHYEKNFSSYINDLRITYLLKELRTNHSLQTNTVKALARKLGFHSPEVFTKAFKKHTGITPSNYLNTYKS